MDVTIFQINGRIYRLANVSIMMEDKEQCTIAIWLEDSSFKKFETNLIAQIKIGGKHEYKKG